jgi:transposase-like protein
MPRHRPLRPPLREAVARQLLAESKQPGSSLAAVARDHGLNYSTLHSWKRKLSGAARRVAAKKPSFAEVKVTASPAAVLELHTPEGFTIRLASGFAAEDLRRILESLRAS